MLKYMQRSHWPVQVYCTKFHALYQLLIFSKVITPRVHAQQGVKWLWWAWVIYADDRTPSLLHVPAVYTSNQYLLLVQLLQQTSHNSTKSAKILIIMVGHVVEVGASYIQIFLVDTGSGMFECYFRGWLMVLKRWWWSLPAVYRLTQWLKSWVAASRCSNY